LVKAAPDDALDDALDDVLKGPDAATAGLDDVLNRLVYNTALKLAEPYKL
jgi:hypothetical protein